jgi:hypothetical protein
MARQIALDHNFPEPVLANVDRWLKDVEFHHLRHIDPALAELQDHQLIYDLHDRDLPILVTTTGRWRTTYASWSPCIARGSHY